MANDEVNEAYKIGKKHERERIMNLIKEWELKDFGNLDARFDGMQKLKDVILGVEE